MDAGGERFGPRVLVIRREVQWPLVCALVVAASGGGALTYGLHGLRFGITSSGGGTLFVGLLALVFGVLAAAVLWLVKPTARREVSVEAHAGQLVIRFTALSATGAIATPIRDSWRVDVYDGGRLPAAVFTAISREDAVALAAAATPAPGDLPATFRIPFYESRGATVLAALGIAFGVFGLRLGKSSLAWVALLASGLCVGLMLVTQRLTIGRDAIRLDWLRSTFYLALANIADIGVHRGKLRLRLRTGRTLTLGVRHHGLGTPESNAAAIAECIARIVSATPGEADEAEALLAQGSRSCEAWRDALWDLRSKGYRDHALSVDRLWSILEHPRTTASARVGAAILLTDTLDGEGRARLRRFAAGCVFPKLRRQLEEVAAGD